MKPALHRMGLFFGALALLACPDSTHLKGTALFLSVELGPGCTVNQLRLSGQSEGESLFPTSVRPDNPLGPALEGTQTLRLLLGDERGGHEALLWVDGLNQGEAICSGHGAVEVETGVEKDLVVQLAPLEMLDAGVDGGADGGAGGCTALQCAVLGGDRCVGGECQCGDGGSCGLGSTCDGGACWCDSLSCPTGCCSGPLCIAPPTLNDCGSDGGACTSCSPQVATACSPTGGCLCGAGPACNPGTHCDAGTCECNAASCPNGCCRASTDGGHAECLPSTLNSCGTGGRACVSCNPLRADNCSDAGTCRCGAGPACPSLTQCMGPFLGCR